MKAKKWLRPEGDGAEREKRGSSFPPPGFSFYPSCFLISFHDTKRERRSTTREFGKRLISSRLRPFSTIRSSRRPISIMCQYLRSVLILSSLPILVFFPFPFLFFFFFLHSLLLFLFLLLFVSPWRGSGSGSCRRPDSKSGSWIGQG